MKKPLVEEDTFVEIFICFFCEKEFNLKKNLRQHQQVCTMRPPELQAMSDSTDEAQPIMIQPPRLYLSSPDSYKRAPRSHFVEALGLIPRLRAEVMENMKRGKQIDCDVIDVDENQPPKTPTTPRTPKSLISQLSRDASSSARRSLSLSLSEKGQTFGGAG